jgi:hypothetical protein
MRDDDLNRTLAGGYGSPPTNSRFKQGQSGNPKGRPKGSLNLATVLQRALREKVVIKENGRRKEMTKLEAAITQLVSKATSGDGQAMRFLCQLVVSAEQRSDAVEPTAQFSETDQKVMDNILKRFQKSLAEGNNEADSE